MIWFCNDKQITKWDDESTVETGVILTKYFFLLCKKFPFCVNSHRFITTIELQGNSKEKTGFDCTFWLQDKHEVNQADVIVSRC